MPHWFHRIDKSFRETLNSYGKSYSEISKGCKLMDSTLKDLQKAIPKKYSANFTVWETDKEKWQQCLKDHEFVLWRKLNERIEECIEHFDFCNDFAIDIIKKEEWVDFDFDGDLLGMFNSYMNEFWDICNTVIFVPVGEDAFSPFTQKFCWIEL